MSQLIDQLPMHTLLMGDFITHNPIWYDQRLDQRGEQIQRLMDAKNLTALNEDCLTYYRLHDQVTSSIDLSLVTNSCAIDFNWNTLDDQHGSDHYPILVSALQTSSPFYTERYNLNLADWNKYTEHAKATKKSANSTENIHQNLTQTSNKIKQS